MSKKIPKPFWFENPVVWPIAVVIALVYWVFINPWDMIKHE